MFFEPSMFGNVAAKAQVSVVCLLLRKLPEYFCYLCNHIENSQKRMILLEGKGNVKKDAAGKERWILPSFIVF